MGKALAEETLNFHLEKKQKEVKKKEGGFRGWRPSPQKKRELRSMGPEKRYTRKTKLSKRFSIIFSTRERAKRGVKNLKLEGQCQKGWGSREAKKVGGA